MGESNLDRMKRAAANKPVASPPKPPSVVAKPNPPKPAKKVVEKVKIEVDVVVHKCGHSTAANMLRNIKCPLCQQKDRSERAKRKREKKPPLPLDMGGEKPGRLPDGVTKTMKWIGGRWIGTMSVLGINETFSADEETEKKCLHKLHDVYMGWKSTQVVPDTAPAG